MKQIYQNLSISVKHLSILDETFSEANNFSNKDDHELYVESLKEIETISKRIGFASELYSEDDRQMKLADILEYIFFSRGVFSLIDNKNQLIKKNIPDYLKLILQFVNLLMLYEVMTTDVRLRKMYLQNLKKQLKGLAKEANLKKLLKWNKWVGLTEKDTPKGAPNDYFDSLLPKTAGGLWHEMLVFAFLLKYNVGYIFPLLLHQKVISLDQKLSPPDLIILHKKTNRYYGIEIGNLKERQSGGFMAPSGIPVIPLDTLNCRISDRCPTCKKWIGICPKVMDDFTNQDKKINRLEIRCLYDCDKFTLKEKISGKCPYMKYFDTLHHHYKCVSGKSESYIKREIIQKHKLKERDLENLLKQGERNLPIASDDMRSRKINCLKTHYLWYPELSKLI